MAASAATLRDGNFLFIFRFHEYCSGAEEFVIDGV